MKAMDLKILDRTIESTMADWISPSTSVAIKQVTDDQDKILQPEKPVDMMPGRSSAQKSRWEKAQPRPRPRPAQ
jgi:hypothetical protein